MRKESDRDERQSTTFEPRNPDELSHFFKANEDRYDDIWVVLTKKKYADPQPVSGNEALKEATRHGLIDSRTRSLGKEKYEMQFTKRLPGSHWSRINAKIAEEIKREQKTSAQDTAKTRDWSADGCGHSSR